MVQTVGNKFHLPANEDGTVYLTGLGENNLCGIGIDIAPLHDTTHLAVRLSVKGIGVVDEGTLEVENERQFVIHCYDIENPAHA